MEQGGIAPAAHLAPGGFGHCSQLPQILRQLGFRGAITIEREVSGPQQVEDVKKAKAYLEKLIG